MSGVDQIVTSTVQSDNQSIPTSAGLDGSPTSTLPTETPVVKQKKALCRFYSTKRGTCILRPSYQAGTPICLIPQCCGLPLFPSSCTPLSRRSVDQDLGCRAGASCPYRHVPKHDQSLPTGDVLPDSPDKVTVEATHHINTSAIRAGSSSKSTRPPINARQPVSKPVPAQQRTNPREFQIGQVVRRFTPTRTEDANGYTVLAFDLAPSDPDFPFEITALKCSLTVPVTWPVIDPKPSLKVANAEIPRGFQINVERGFDTLISSGKTLLVLLNDLDRNLERFLSSEKAQTIKIVANRAKPEPISAPPVQFGKQSVLVPTPLALPTPSWTPQQKHDAAAKRDADISQLESRMGRLVSFQKTRVQQNWSFNIPVTIPKPGRLPLSLQSLKEVILLVPQLYNLEPCSIQLKGVSGAEAKAVENNFGQHATEHSEMTLMAHINHLIQHLHEMITIVAASIATVPEPSTQVPPAEISESDASEHDIEGKVDAERPHLIFLSQPPPEWTHHKTDNHSSSESDSEDYDTTEDSDDNEEDEVQGGASIPTSTHPALEKGIMISFPELEMTGMELLELSSLSVTVKCDRCKQTHDFKNIKPAESPSGTSIRTESCSKCNSLLSTSYKPDLIHASSIKAGTINLEGASILDMLPSTFTPTCSSCSTTAIPTNTITTVRGDTALSICRTCHQKMTLKLSAVKFLLISHSSHHPSTLPPRRKKKETLGITTGTELPLRGRCPHYSKSYRWFRFSCCQRVYACDRCHDAAEQHPNEHANRMICGWCSREQNYRPEDCHFCGRSVVRKAGGGFWEGGKGTRDKVKMSRKDPRKYKRIGGGADKK